MRERASESAAPYSKVAYLQKFPSTLGFLDVHSLFRCSASGTRTWKREDRLDVIHDDDDDELHFLGNERNSIMFALYRSIKPAEYVIKKTDYDQPARNSSSVILFSLFEVVGGIGAVGSSK